MTTQTRYAVGIQIAGPITPEFAEILTPEAMDIVAQLIRTFAGRREDLLRRRVLRQAAIPEGTITEAGLRTNINVSLQYMESWLNGLGCVPINNLMEDAATVEISRSQIWQWIHHPQGILEDGRKVTIELFRQIEAEELARIKQAIGEDQYAARKLDQAAQLLDHIITEERFVEFLTLPAYKYLP